jgi:hypothetical protein
MPYFSRSFPLPPGKIGQPLLFAFRAITRATQFDIFCFSFLVDIVSDYGREYVTYHAGN